MHAHVEIRAAVRKGGPTVERRTRPKARYTRADLLNRTVEERVRKLLAGQLCDPEVLEADGVWLSDVTVDGLERVIRLGVAGDPLADQALAWAKHPHL